MENASVLLGGPLKDFNVMSEGDVLAYTFKGEVPNFAIAINFGDSEGTISLNKIGVNNGKLKYHTDDKSPGGLSIAALKVPAKVLYLLEVTERL